MSQRHDSAKSIFLSALEIAPAPARQEYMAAACGEDRPLFEEVQKLINHQAQAESFLESPAAGDALAATVDGPGEKQLGRHIGAYKIRELIGEGGMGAVYLAEQERPLRRKVALKVIKPGMDSKAVLGRFDAERNALALMNHPNIAKVLDAGTTEDPHQFQLALNCFGGTDLGHLADLCSKESEVCTCFTCYCEFALFANDMAEFCFVSGMLRASHAICIFAFLLSWTQ